MKMLLAHSTISLTSTIKFTGKRVFDQRFISLLYQIHFVHSFSCRLFIYYIFGLVNTLRMRHLSNTQLYLLRSVHFFSFSSIQLKYIRFGTYLMTHSIKSCSGLLRFIIYSQSHTVTRQPQREWIFFPDYSERTAVELELERHKISTWLFCIER